MRYMKPFKEGIGALMSMPPNALVGGLPVGGYSLCWLAKG